MHRLSADWNETSATWNCQDDTNLGNSTPDCEELWAGGFFDEQISASLLHVNNETGWKSFNVTSDVQIIQGGNDHFGWLVGKKDQAAAGSLDYTSSQGTASFKPRLEVTVDDQITCTATGIESISPAIIPSDGSANTITIKGQGLDRVTSILVDNGSISYTLVDSNTITFSRNYASVADHIISIQSNCLSAPIEDYTLVSDTAQYLAAQSQLEAGVTCNATSTFTNFSISNNGKVLCWKGAPARLNGYSGDFAWITNDSKWGSGTDEATIQAYFRKGQYLPGSGTTSKGSNFIRVVAVGGSCRAQGGGPGTCKVGTTTTETMPFKFLNNKYQIPSTNDYTKLSLTWRMRLKKFIKYADRNGFAVMMSLFDENVASGATWLNNPWNPNWNNLSPSNCLPTSGDSLPAFYQNGPSNCVKNGQQYYVKSIVSFLKSSALLICGSSGTARCKNVILEVMNEARLHNGWAPGFDENSLKTWHQTIGTFIKGTSLPAPFLLSADVKGQVGVDECPLTSNAKDDQCMMEACTQSSCPDVNNNQNFFQVFTGGTSNKIDIVSLHYPTWGWSDVGNQNVDGDDICVAAPEADDFSKPVIFDDDGGIELNANNGRNNNCNLEYWSESVSPSPPQIPACDVAYAKGKLHYYHTGDGTTVEGSIQQCEYLDTGKIDCNAWDAIADGLPTVLCPQTGCVDSRVTYCENKPCNTQNCSQ